MPIYEFECEKHGMIARYLPLKDFNQPQSCDECGLPMTKLMSAPAVRGDYAGYSCPITGDWIEGKKAHEANLRKHGCRLIEPGEARDVARRKAADEARLDSLIEGEVVRQVDRMDPTKLQILAGEIEKGEAAGANDGTAPANLLKRTTVNG